MNNTWKMKGFHKYVGRFRQHGVNVRVFYYSVPGEENHHSFYFYWPCQPHEGLIDRELIMDGVE